MYLGGRKKDKCADEREKTAVVSIKDEETGTVRVVPIPRNHAVRLVKFVESNITKNVKLFVD